MRELVLVLRALRFRRGTSAAVLVVAALVIGGAATGPLFVRAAGESMLRDTLAHSALTSGRMVSDRLGARLADHPLATVRRASADRLRRLPTLDRLLGRPYAGLVVDAAVGRGSAATKVQLAWRQGACHHVHLVRGDCPDRSGEVMVSTAAAAALGWHVGSALDVSAQPMRVTGTYRPLDLLGDYWADRPYFAPLSDSGNAGAALNLQVDALFTARSTIESLPGSTIASATLDRRLLLSRIRLADVPVLKRQLTAYGRGVMLPGHRLDTSDTAVPSVLAQAQSIAKTLTPPVVVVETQLLVLCWLVLFLVVANAAEARGPEIALAKLRGLPTASTLTFGLLDSLLLIALAVPLGLAAAFGWVSGMARLQLLSGTPVAMTGPALAAAALAAVGAVVAAVLACTRTLRRPVVDQWRRTVRGARGRSWLVDVVVALAAIGGLVALERAGALDAGATSTWALVTPGLMVLAAALIGSRVLPVLCRAMFGPTRRRGWLAGFLAVRQLARRPSTVRLALVLTVGIGLVTFAVNAWAVGRANAHDRAWTEIGAAESLEVLPPPGRDIASIVDRLDPSDRQAAAVSESADYADAPPVWLLAVQPRRFAQVAFWRADFGPPLSVAAERLVAPVAPPVPLFGEAVEVRVAVKALTGRRAPALVADIGQQGAGLAPVDLGTIRSGRQVLRAALPCSRCFLGGLHLDRPAGAFYPFSARLVIIGVRVRDATGWHPVRAGLARRAQWRATSRGAGPPVPTPTGLVLDAQATAIETPTWQVADWPTSLPVLRTRDAVAAGARRRIAGLDGDALPITATSTGPALPGAGDLEVIVNRAYAQRAMSGESDATDLVWLSRSAMATFPARLQKAGVTIVSTSRADRLAAFYDRQGPELALLLFLCGAALGAVLAAGGCVLSLYIAGRRRSYELAALLAEGVRGRTLFLALVIEQGLLLVFGVAVGFAAGIAGAQVALPAIPEFADAPTAPPMLYGLHPALLTGTVAACVTGLALVVFACSASLLRGSRFTQLREAPA